MQKGFAHMTREEYKKYEEYERRCVELANLYDMIRGELNRIAITDDIREIEQREPYLKHNIETYIKKHIDRVKNKE